MTHPPGQHPEDRRPPRAPRQPGPRHRPQPPRPRSPQHPESAAARPYPATPHPAPPAPARRGGGVPDALLIGSLAVAVSVTLLVWSATGIAGWLRHGTWPEHVSLMNTASAVRSFLTAPSDVAGAWPDADPQTLPGGALLWTVFLAQLTVLFSAFLWSAVRIARWRARRAVRARATAVPAEYEEPEPPRPRKRLRPEDHEEYERYEDYGHDESHGSHGSHEAHGMAAAPDRGGEPSGPVDDAGYPDVPRPTAPTAPRGTDPVSAVLRAPGGIVVPDPDGTLHRKTARQRGRTGPVHVYDPGHASDDVPVRLRWSPHRGCEDLSTARWRAIAFLSPVRPAEPVFQLDADTAETLLRCYLHAAALSSQPFHHIQRWVQGRNGGEAGKVLRSHPRAAPGSSMELESALTSHPGRRDAALALLEKALSGLDQLHIRQSCAPGRVDTLALDNIAGEDGTLYIIGADPVTAPFRAALLDAVSPALTPTPAPH
ncbi:hypothetical protein [Streptomyces aidingensis]|uniref:Type VI secretion protein n=1 Tax=Streptomyces aidingensis TaxID=910347 RepID=A0A1I1DZP1_9ACTN|nr:hypothetical protein [Streptomyces aidingensis]SFB79896.1 hypothetical protein SAMN05421773_10134 [Streptomyces aidingensis]